MRLWSLHPSYLDRRGLVALWREGLLAQAVLRGRTRGYMHHPQLERFRASGAPVAMLAAYLRIVEAEALRRGYVFDRSKIVRAGARVRPLTVTRDQLLFEWQHLRAKVAGRDPEWLHRLVSPSPRANPLFRIVRGGVESWERGIAPDVTIRAGVQP